MSRRQARRCLVGDVRFKAAQLGDKAGRQQIGQPPRHTLHRQYVMMMMVTLMMLMFSR